MLMAKGSRVGVLLRDGRRVRGHGALLHDPTGKDWPKCSALIAPITRGGSEVRDSEAEAYFGYRPRKGSLLLPPRDLSAWKRLGSAAAIIDYTRPGRHKGDYRHDFKAGSRVTVYRRGRLLRLELGRSCAWNWRGFVSP